jgi:MFS family permease
LPDDDSPHLPPDLDAVADVSERPGLTGWLRRAAVDVTPLRESKHFRRLWFGTGISAIGSQITVVAIPFHVYDLTGSTAILGLLGLVTFVPLLTVPLYAGAVADAVDRRRLLLLSDLALMVVTGALVVNALLPSPSVVFLFVAQILATAAYGFQRPARNALTPRLVKPEQLTAAIAVEDVVSNLARVGGPALAGLLIAAVGLAAAYAVDVATFAASLLAIFLLPAVPPGHDAERASLRAILDGFRYVRTKPALLGIFLVDTIAMIFGMPAVLFPAFAEELGGGAGTVGLLYAAPYAGALAASLLSGWIGHVHRQGLGVCVAAGGWGLAIAAFGLADAVWVALLFLAVAGAADYVSAVLRSVILIAATPDSMRGRLSGIELAQVAGAPQLGNFEAGIVASLVSLRFSIVSGGILCVAGTILVALALPALLRYDSRRPHE